MKTGHQKQPTLTHKTYTGTVETSLEDECLMGRVLHIDDLVTYEGQTIPELVQAFKSAVDRYVQHCRSIGKQPNKPYSGTFNVRIGADLHRELADMSQRCGSSINELVIRSVEMLVDGGRTAGEVHIHITRPEVAETTAASSSKPTQMIVKSTAPNHGRHVH